MFTGFLCVALYREFSNERTRVERQAKYYKMRTKKKYIDTFNTYINWITAAGIYPRVPNARIRFGVITLIIP